MLSKTATGQGISARNRQRLAGLLRGVEGPFTVRDASEVLDADAARTRRFLAYLAAQGWLIRIRSGIYERAPLEVAGPVGRERMWAKAYRIFAPCYLGGFTAASYWGLTEQFFRNVMVLSTRWTRNRRPTIQGVQYEVKVIAPKRLFGTRLGWDEDLRVEFSDPARTIVDTLDDPAMGGGIRQVADTVQNFFLFAELRNDERLLEYIERFGNRSLYKRLGYLIEKLEIDAPEVLETCARRMSQGVVRLYPGGPDIGRPVKRWRLVVNSTIAPHDS